jgi:hypothetical protein
MFFRVVRHACNNGRFCMDVPESKGPLLLGYARVPKGDDQTNTTQAKALRAAGCNRIFKEVASCGRWDRPELHRLLDQLPQNDIIVVWKLDRLSRSLKDVLHMSGADRQSRRRLSRPAGGHRRHNTDFARARHSAHAHDPQWLPAQHHGHERHGVAALGGDAAAPVRDWWP